VGLETPERTRIAFPRPYWYVACRSRELGARPIARSLFDTPLVLFRGEGGRVGALLDRCAHRNLPLSAGRVVGPHLECAYHGWQYDTGGVCRRVPALGAEPENKGRLVPSFPAVEQQGVVWVYADSERPPAGGPYTFPALGAPGYGSVHYASEVEATLYATLENMLDVPHTAFLHRGLFRSGPKRPIAAIVRRFADRVEAEYVGEPRPSGLLGRLLAPRGGTVVHFDRFLLPSIAQVEYRLGESHLLVTNALTPIDEFRTRFLAVVSFRLPIPKLLVRAVLMPLSQYVVRQDARILRLQTDAIRRFGGESYVSTDVDVLGPHIWRLLKQAAERAEAAPAGREAEVEKRVELHV
jgi:phenylpropionate dioxygenase-like ring-hydroxylating dioxygenase large terminal subunit